RDELPNTGPAAGGGSLFDEPMFIMADAVGVAAEDWRRHGFFGNGNLILKPGGERFAAGLHRADQTLGRARRANDRAKLHHCRIELAGLGARDDLLGTMPKQLLRTPIARIDFDFVDPAKHALDVAIQNGGALVESEGSDRASRVSSDARKTFQCFQRGRNPAAVLGDNLLGRFAEISRPAVITKALPHPQ